MYARLFTAVLLSFSAIALGQVTNCSVYNTTKGPYPYGTLGTAQHSSGSHGWANEMQGTCTYTGAASYSESIPCTVHSVSTSSSGASDTGNTVPYWHNTNFSDKGGMADGPNGGTATTDAEGAAAAVSCAIFPCGAPAVNISGSGNGGGFTVSFTPSNVLWQSTWHYSNTCTAYTLPPLVPTTSCPNPNPPYPPYNEGQGSAYWYWDVNTCQWVDAGASPIIIDTTGGGFKFSDPTKGQYVSFDIEGNGVYKKVSWPLPGSGNAWLALDRDGDGMIKDGTELFGDFTPHSNADNPNYPNPNGFVALDWYDQPAQGGDMNLIIDKKDAIWSKLRLWVDEHCYKEPDKPCRSRPNELHSLESKGINSISLVWDASTKIDPVGNQFKFYSVLNPEAETKPKDEHGNVCCDLHQRSADSRLAYDVFLKTVD